MEPSYRGFVAPVVVVFNTDHQGGEEDAEPPLLSDSSIADTAQTVVRVLSDAGIRCHLLGLDRSTAPLRRVAQRLPEAVFFNLVESLDRDSSREREIPRELERLGVAYTGNPGDAIARAFDKVAANRLLHQHDVPVPAGVVAEGGNRAVTLAAARGLRFPLFVKPARADASIGVSQQSLVHTDDELRQQVDMLAAAGLTPALVEEYLPGPECSVAVCPNSGRFIHAVSCIDFSAFNERLAPIVTYDCKWTPESAEYNAQSVPARTMLSPQAVEAVLKTGLAALAAIGATGSARADLRFDRDGVPRVIDLNPNPDLDPEAGFARAIRSTGISYQEMLLAMIESAQVRLDGRPIVYEY